MEIAERNAGEVPVLDLSGRITLGEGDVLLKDKLHSLLNQGRKDVLLNLARVQYVDNAGLGAIVFETFDSEGEALRSYKN